MLHIKFKRVGENVAWLVGERLLRMSLGVVVLGLVARHLGPTQFGYLNYAISLATIFTTVATLGMEGIVIRELVKAPENQGTILGTAFRLRLLGGVAALAIVVLAGCLSTDRRMVAPVAIIVALGFFPQAFEVIDLWFQKNIQSKFTVMARIGAALVGSGIKIGLALANAPLVMFAAALAFDSVLIAIALVIIFRQRDGRMREWSYSRDLARLILRDSWPLILSGVLVAAYMRVEQVLVMIYFGGEKEGLYFSAVRLTELWLFIPTLLLASIYPLLVEKRRQGMEAYRYRLLLVFDLLTGIGLVVAVGMTVAGPYVLPLIFGNRYAAAVPTLIVLAWTAPATFSGSVRAQYFLIEGFTIYHTASALIGMAVNITVAVCLMPRYGITGAAFGALSGYLVSAYVTSWIFPPLRDCARLQTKAFFVFFRWHELVAALRPSA